MKNMVKELEFNKERELNQIGLTGRFSINCKPNNKI